MKKPIQNVGLALQIWESVQNKPTQMKIKSTKEARLS